MGKLLLIGLGGFIGSILRYLVSAYVQQLSPSVAFPYGTLAVNVAGCCAIGVLSHLAEVRGLLTAEAGSLLIVGILGSFTTFSTFGNETFNLWRDGQGLPALMNVAVHIILGLGAVWLGRGLGAWVWG